jgi:hypothetical protein
MVELVNNILITVLLFEALDHSKHDTYGNFNAENSDLMGYDTASVDNQSDSVLRSLCVHIFKGHYIQQHFDS